MTVVFFDLEADFLAFGDEAEAGDGEADAGEDIAKEKGRELNEGLRPKNNNTKHKFSTS